jgi:hypothetical protein
LFYFLENQDEVKNFSYKRRKHRFCEGMDISQVDDLYEQLRLALLSYTDTEQEIEQSLANDFEDLYELMDCTMESFPGKPSYFLAVKKNKSSKSKTTSSFSFKNPWSNTKDDSIIEILLVVRGTKTITDVITDLLCEDVPYRGGSAHAGILQSGQYLAKKHEPLFRKLQQQFKGEKSIQLTLIGHSLGAGAASIAGMELQDLDCVEKVKVIGFGCPALLSKDLSEKTLDYITTVVADNDCIPRMSTATMVNTILDIGSYNWIPYARRDIQEAIDQVQQSNSSSYLPSMLLTEDTKQRILSIVDDILPDNTPLPEQQRMEPVLFPPGKCIHFYRDGFGISGNVVPCTFFKEIDFSRRMVHDHLFQTGYRLIFLDLMRQYHNNHYFRFENDATTK